MLVFLETVSENLFETEVNRMTSSQILLQVAAAKLRSDTLEDVMNQEGRGKQHFSFLFSLNSDNKLQYRSDVQKNGRVTGQISAKIFQGSPFFSGIGSPTQALSKLEGNEQRPRPRLEPGRLSFFRLGICGYITSPGMKTLIVNQLIVVFANFNFMSHKDSFNLVIGILAQHQHISCGRKYHPGFSISEDFTIGIINNFTGKTNQSREQL